MFFRYQVLSEFNARSGDGKVYTEEKLLAKFTRKVHKNSRLKVHKEIVKLVQSDRRDIIQFSCSWTKASAYCSLMDCIIFFLCYKSISLQYVFKVCDNSRNYAQLLYIGSNNKRCHVQHQSVNWNRNAHHSIKYLTTEREDKS